MPEYNMDTVAATPLEPSLMSSGLDSMECDDFLQSEEQTSPTIKRRTRLRRNSNKSSQKDSDVDEDSSEMKAGRKSSSRKTNNTFLHSDKCWVTVKWEGLSYADISFEDLNDVRNKVRIIIIFPVI